MSEQKVMTELKVSGHLMRLDAGIYCVFHATNGRGANPATGLPGVRISLPPAGRGSQGKVEISGFREDGWVSTGHDAALIRVSDGPAQVLVTVYQSTVQGEPLPQLQVVRLGDILPTGTAPGTELAAPAAALAKPGAKTEPATAGGRAPAAAPGPGPGVIAHVQKRGDVEGASGQWVGERGSKLWIEGFSLHPPPDIRAEDIEYQAVLGRGWLSPWSQGGQFCGSRRMALPVLGLRVRLRGAAAAQFECACSATFIDGSMVGPVAAGEACEAATLAPLEAFQVILRPRQSVRKSAPAAEPRETPQVAARVRMSARSRAQAPVRSGKRERVRPG